MVHALEKLVVTAIARHRSDHLRRYDRVLFDFDGITASVAIMKRPADRDLHNDGVMDVVTMTWPMNDNGMLRPISPARRRCGFQRL